MRYDLYVITDTKVSGGLTHDEMASMAVRGGADVIQLRDKEMDAEQMLVVASAMRRITEGTGAKLIINDHLDVAVRSGADGVHLGQGDISIQEARVMTPPGFIIGISASTVEEAVAAELGGADYIGFGPVFPTTSKDDAGPVCGLALLQDVKAAVSIPVVAIGGICRGNVDDTIRHGADGIAVISAVLAQDDVVAACRDLRQAVEVARSE